jgi:hypothetical protein
LANGQENCQRGNDIVVILTQLAENARLHALPSHSESDPFALDRGYGHLALQHGRKLVMPDWSQHIEKRMVRTPPRAMTAIRAARSIRPRRQGAR